jgi:hypothetical protein
VATQSQVGYPFAVLAKHKAGTNGAAKNLSEIVNFYNLRFEMNLTDEEKAELVAFLNSL